MSQQTKKLKGRFIWSKDATLSLITMYQNNPVLYNIADGEYKNKSKRQTVLTKIKNELLKLDICKKQCMNIEDIKNKIHVLRTQFNKEYKKVKESETTGVAPEDLYQPTLWCYEELLFLKDSNIVCESFSNLDYMVNDTDSDRPTTPISESDDYEMVYDGPIEDLAEASLQVCQTQQEQNFPTQKKKGKESVQKEVVKLLSTATAALESRSNANSDKENNDISSFCRHLAVEMQKIKNKALVRKLKLQFMTTVFNEIEEENM